MKSNRKWLREASHCCAEIGPEDGIDPRILAKTDRPDDRAKPRDLQLCKCAERTIHFALAACREDTGLESLIVRRVELSKDGRSFVVSLFTPGDPNPESLDSIAERLARIRGHIRTLIAQSVRRKRVPALRFRLTTSDATTFYTKVF